MLKLLIYIDNGLVYSYEVTDQAKAREHAAAIIKTGYRHNDGKGDFVHYPPHRIDKVKVTGGAIETMYPDNVCGT